MSEIKQTKNLGILASGNGSNLQAIIDATKTDILSGASVKVVISDNKNAYALKRAKTNGIDNIYLNIKDFSSKEDYDKKICDILFSHDVYLVILAGYLKILTKPLLDLYKNKILNIHPSLLPAFGGVNMYGMKVHKAVIDSGQKTSGCTVHVVTENVDQGPIIDQVFIDVLNDDTPDSLAKRILKYEHEFYPRAIAKYLHTLGSDIK